MKKLEDMDQNAEGVMKKGLLSDADLDQVNGGLFEGFGNRFSLKDLLFRKDKDDAPEAVLLPMRPDHENDDDRDQQQGGPKIVRL